MLNKQDYNLYKPDFELQKSKLNEFFTSFTDKSIKNKDDIHGNKKYMIELVHIILNFSKKSQIKQKKPWKSTWKT